MTYWKPIWVCIAAVMMTVGLSGCGDPKPQNIMEGTPEDKLAEYERMIAEGENQQTSADPSETTDAQ